MKSIRKGISQQEIKSINRLVVRDLIRELGPVSRNQLAQASGLALPTITGIVNELLRTSVVRETGRGESSGGRRPAILELNARVGFIFVLHLRRGEIEASLLDLDSNVEGSTLITFHSSSPEDVVRSIVASFESLLCTTGVSKDAVLKCGVATSGIVDHENGFVHSTSLGWHNVPLGRMLATALDGIPIYVEKNASAAAVAERVYGNGRGCSNLIYLNLASGVGAGIIIADQIFRGSSGYGGEVGHIPILSGDAPLCVCGRHGCFEALCGTGTVMKRIMELPDEVFRSIGIRAEELRIEDVIGSPIANHPEVQKILGHVGRMVGIGVATLINLFEPEAVILGGPLSKTGNSFINAVVDTVGQTILTDLAERVRIRESSMTTDPVSMGVYAMVIDQLFALGDWKRPKGLHKD